MKQVIGYKVMSFSGRKKRVQSSLQQLTEWLRPWKTLLIISLLSRSKPSSTQTLYTNRFGFPLTPFKGCESALRIGMFPRDQLFWDVTSRLLLGILSKQYAVHICLQTNKSKQNVWIESIFEAQNILLFLSRNSWSLGNILIISAL